MNDIPTWLAAVKESPEDIALRLVMADWVEEHGSSPAEQARGEFMRLQCRAGRMAWNAPEQAELNERQEELLGNHAEAWLGELAGKVPHWEFRAGLLSVWVTREVLRSEGLAGLARAPGWIWVDHLRVYPGPLGAEHPLGPEGARELARSPHLRGLNFLDLEFNEIGDAGAVALGESPHLNFLTSLTLVGNNIGIAGTRALASSSHLTRLAKLDLMGNEIGNGGARILAEGHSLAGLTSLSLGQNRIEAAGARALANSTQLAKLAQLDLTENSIGDTGAAAFAIGAGLPALSSLELDSTEIGEAGALALAASPRLDKLTWLGLSGNDISVAAGEVLRQRYGRRVHL
jgi:uncharacterized protein (TIGR02996 family)